MTDDASRLLALFDLQPDGDGAYVAPNPGEFSWGRVFGGQVVAQALRAATLTVDPDRSVHSLHSYFIRGGKPGVPIRLEVDRTRDGRSFSTRYVVAKQDGDVIFNMTASLHRQEDGPEYQLPIAQDVPPPGQAVGFSHHHGSWRSSMEARELGPTPADERGVYRSTKRTWMRIGQPIGDDPVIHQCAIAFMSDMGASMGAYVPHLMSEHGRGFGGASLDHSLWFHRPARADDWLLFDLHAVSISGSRGFTRGTMHTHGGVLAVSITQEALQRPTGSVFG